MSEKVTAFGPVTQVDAGLLDVGYVDAGQPEGPANSAVRGEAKRHLCRTTIYQPGGCHEHHR
jgi:hypothetical protein